MTDLTGPNLTEERLRSHLDSNQVMRERLCLSILPLLGPYTRERPRRPKGGPDGGRDIEALYNGSSVVWGAVGFRNGGGNDQTARRETKKKFENDLGTALAENSELQVFVFFTNVDLTPGIKDELKQIAIMRGVDVADIFDMEILRHVLDSPEGLLARLQYLAISMSSEEQIALIGKFGDQMRGAILSRFDRVEQILSNMQRFLDFQKPVHRIDVYTSLKGQYNSKDIGTGAVMIEIFGIHGANTSCD